VNWVTRAGVHIDRAACAWLIRRFVDPDARFAFVTESDQVPDDTIAFDMPGVDLSHHTSADGQEDCSFETFLRRYDLTDPVLWHLARIVHEADLDDQRYDAPEARGLDTLTRGLSMVATDEQIVHTATLIFDGLYEFHRRALVLGREPS
jgi:hypothetical protein